MHWKLDENDLRISIVAKLKYTNVVTVLIWGLDKSIEKAYSTIVHVVMHKLQDYEQIRLYSIYDIYEKEAALRDVEIFD